MEDTIMYFSKEQSLKLVELGKTNKTALRAFILFGGYGKPVLFSNNSLAAKLDVSPSSVSIALKALKASELIKLYKVGTAYICVPAEENENWVSAETGDLVADFESIVFVSKSEQDDLGLDFTETPDDDAEISVDEASSEEE